MSGEIEFTLNLNRSEYPVMDTEQLGYVSLDIRPIAGATPTATTHTMPLNLALVLDRSGSMDGAKIDQLRDAAKQLVTRLNPQDNVAVIIFDETVDIVAPSQSAANQQQLHAQIDRIMARGGTKISVGMEAGLTQLQQHNAPNRINRMVLLTDGETWEDEPRCRQLAQEAGQLGIPITALGLGDEWNQTLLTDLATASGGNWEYIDTPDKINGAFQHVVTAMQGTVVSNAFLTLRLAEGVSAREVWRVTPLIDKLSQRAISTQDVQVSLGDLQEEGQSLLVELLFPPRQAGSYRLAHAEVSYDVPSAGLYQQKVQEDVMVGFSTDSNQPLNGKIMNIVEKVSTFKLMTTALDPRNAADAGIKTRRLRAAATRLLTMGEAQLAQQAQDAATQIAAGQQVSSRATKKLTATTRRLDMSDLDW